MVIQLISIDFEIYDNRGKVTVLVTFLIVLTQSLLAFCCHCGLLLMMFSDRSNLKEEGFILAHSLEALGHVCLVQFIAAEHHGGRSGWPGLQPVYVHCGRETWW